MKKHLKHLLVLLRSPDNEFMAIQPTSNDQRIPENFGGGRVEIRTETEFWQYHLPDNRFYHACPIGVAAN